MSLHCHSVVYPFRVDPNSQGAVHTLHVEAASSSPEAGIRIAKTLAPVVSQLRYGATPVQLYPDRISADKARGQIPGPYAYIIGRSNRVPHLVFAPRLDETASAEFRKSLEGIDPTQTYGVLLDCAGLGYINSPGLTALAEFTSILNLHCFRMPPKIIQIMQITGLDKVCHLHDSLARAAAGLIQHAAGR